ncbi:T9SS type A sorting domain-containing protein [Ancylomarina sp. YFZ004]
MRISFTLLIALFLIPFYGVSQGETPVYNTDDVAVLKKIANDNSLFIHRLDWLNDTPEWTGVTWSDATSDKKVEKLILRNSKMTGLDITELEELVELDFYNGNWGSDDSPSYFNVAGLKKLKILKFCGSYVESIDFSGLENLKRLDISSNDLESLNLSGFVNLEELYCTYNRLTQIDVSNCINLKVIDCNSNKLPFTQLYPLLVIDSHVLGSEYIKVFSPTESDGIVDYRGEAEFDGHITEFKWYNNVDVELNSSEVEMLEPGLFSLKVAGEFYCKMTNILFPSVVLTTHTVSILGKNKNENDIIALKKIAEENTKFIYRDDWLSDNPDWKGVVWGGLLSDTRVVELSIEDGKLSKLDASALTELRKIQVNSWYHIKTKLKEVNLSGLEQLRVFSCSVNEIETLDLTTAVNIEKLNVSYNQLSEIDISNNPSLKELYFSGNLMTFSKLFPLKSFIDNNNFSQKPLLGEMVSNGLVDLSSEADVNGTATNFKWFNSLGVELTPDQVETTDVGIFTFKLAGDFYCEMTNDLFPDLTLRTNKVTIKAASNNTDDIKTLKGIAEENPKFIYRDDWLSESPEWEGVTWGGSLSDARVVILNLKESNITNLDVSSLSLLVEFDCSSIWSSEIRLSNLNIDGLQYLERVDCSNNKLLELNLTNIPHLKYLNAEDNNLVSLDLSALANLENLRIEGNELKSLDLTNLNKLIDLGCRYNQLTTLIKPNPSVLEQWYCNYNALSFSNLYHFRDFNQVYWREQGLIFDELTTKGNIDYSSESEFDHFKTEFKWFHTAGTELTSSEIETVGPGQFTFKIAGTFYCEMTNVLFQDMTLRTKTVTVEGTEKNLADIEILRQLAEENSEFIYRDDWLSDEPEWKGVVWGGSLDDMRVVEINIEAARFEKLDLRPLSQLKKIKLNRYNARPSLVELNINELKELKYLDIDRNEIASLDLSAVPELETLICTDNKLETIDLSQLPKLKRFSCAENNLTNIDISQNPKLVFINCQSNRLSFSQLFPLLSIDSYYCTYQSEIFETMESIGIVDYSSEAEFDGVKTVFKWYNSFGTELKEDEIELIEPGKFYIKIKGEFYCKMTNPLFEDMTLKTNTVKITSGSDPYGLNKNWIRKNNFAGGSRQGAVGFSIGSSGYLGLGENNGLLKDLWRYNSDSDSWWRLDDCPFEARRNAVGFAIDGIGYMGLGKNDTDKFVDLWQFNPDNNTWTQVADYPGKNTDLASWVVHNNKVYFFCGRDEVGNYSNEVWEYNPTENSWLRKNDFPGDKRIFSAAYSMQGKIYVGNGQNYENGSMMTNDLWEYMPETDTWIEQDMLLGYTTMSPSYFSIGDKAYYGLSGFSSGSFYQLDPVKEEFEESIFPYVESGKNLNQPVIFIINKQAYVCTGYQKESYYNETNIAEVIVFDPPAPPVVKVQNFVATLADDFKVKLEWEDMSVSEIRQEILYSKDGENFELLATEYANSGSFVSQDLEPNTNYWFKIRVVGKWDDSITSDMVNISTLTLPVSEPTEFNAVLFDHLKVNLIWLDNSRAERYQQVMISEDKETWNAIDVGADLESYTTDYLKAETTYYFKIKSIDKNDNSEESEILSETTSTATVASPTEFQVEVFDYLKVKLLWKDNSRADQSQEIMVSEDKEDWYIIDIDANIETYTTEYLNPETTYYFRLKSIGVDGDLAETDIVSVTLGENVFNSATNLTANLASDLEVKLDWQINSIAGVSQYIMISQDGENYTQHAEISADATTYTTAELKSATSYYFKIMTKFDYHESLISENAEVTTNLVVGIEEIREDEINIYPNPTYDYLRLELPGSDLKKVRILDGKGQVILVKEVINNLTIDVNGFAAGVYFVQIYCDQFSTTKKIIVM